MVDAGLYVGYALLLGTVLFAVLMPLVQALKSPKDLARTGMMVGVLVVVYLISFLLAGSEVTDQYIARGIDESASKRIGSGLVMFYIVFLGALLGIVLSEIKSVSK